jgi:hypothetical protein
MKIKTIDEMEKYLFPLWKENYKNIVNDLYEVSDGFRLKFREIKPYTWTIGSYFRGYESAKLNRFCATTSVSFQNVKAKIIK